MLSSRPTPNSSPSVQERNNAFAQRLLGEPSKHIHTPESSESQVELVDCLERAVQGSQLLQDTLQVGKTKYGRLLNLSCTRIFTIALLSTMLQVLRETGLRAPAMRSLQAGVAVAETLREVAKELAQYQQGAAKVHVVDSAIPIPHL